MGRKYPEERSLGRRTGRKPPGLMIKVFCEGGKTEKKYINDFKRYYRNTLVDVEICESGCTPITLMKKAVKKYKELKREAGRSSNSFDSKFEVWCVFDVDDHDYLPQIKNQAKDINIKL